MRVNLNEREIQLLIYCIIITKVENEVFNDEYKDEKRFDFPKIIQQHIEENKELERLKEKMQNWLNNTPFEE